jgi:dTDP-alpha-D-glucose dehydrogenase
VKFLPEDREPSVAVVGFGYVGSCLGATLAERGTRVIGIDSDSRLIEEMRTGYCRFNEPGLAEALSSGRAAGTLTLSTDHSAVQAADVIIIAVGTPVDADRSVVTDHLVAVCEALAPHMQTGHLVILKSTVPPGTTQGLVRPLLEKGGLVQGQDFGLAFCPERLAEGNALGQFRTIPIVIGGCDDASAEAARAFWTGALDVEVLPFACPEVAEMVKLTDNWWIDANIALANELAQLCGSLGVDVLDVIAGANSLPKGSSHVNVLLPSVGVGGSCLTKDPWILWSTGREHGVRLRIAETAREVNDTMPSYTHGLILEGLTSLGKNPASAKVAVLGLAFKNNTNDLRHTPVRPVVDALRTSCGRVAIYDALVADDAAEAEFGMRQSASVRDAVQDADCVAVLAGHDRFRDLDFTDLARRVSMPCLVIDGRAYYPKQTIDQMRSLGFAYRGIGR